MAPDGFLTHETNESPEKRKRLTGKPASKSETSSVFFVHKGHGWRLGCQKGAARWIICLTESSDEEEK